MQTYFFFKKKTTPIEEQKEPLWLANPILRKSTLSPPGHLASQPSGKKAIITCNRKSHLAPSSESPTSHLAGQLTGLCPLAEGD